MATPVKFGDSKTCAAVAKVVGNDPRQLQELANYVGDLWHCKQGEAVKMPKWMTQADANAICSELLELRERGTRSGGTVPIKKVAEIRGSRFNTGKARMDLLDPDAMEGIAAVLAFGANKYADHNWRKGLPFMETIASMLRHIWKFVRGEDLDEETGLPHVDHIGCNAMFLAWMWRNRKDMDDRWKPVVDNNPNQQE